MLEQQCAFSDCVANTRRLPLECLRPFRVVLRQEYLAVDALWLANRRFAELLLVSVRR
jgi:hypothetical protein